MLEQKAYDVAYVALSTFSGTEVLRPLDHLFLCNPSASKEAPGSLTESLKFCLNLSLCVTKSTVLFSTFISICIYPNLLINILLKHGKGHQAKDKKVCLLSEKQLFLRKIHTSLKAFCVTNKLKLRNLLHALIRNITI